MESKYLRSLSKEAYDNLSRKLWEIQYHKCFICGEDIDENLQLCKSTNIDHISPLTNGGKDSEENFAVTHESCNKSKQDADLKIARILAQLNKITKKAHSKNESPSLRHVLEEYGGSKYEFSYHVEGNLLSFSFNEISNEIKTSEIFTDRLSKEKTAFIQVPIEYLYHDELINPRGINSSISLLVKEFAKGNPQLHLSLARIDDKKIKIFDGQHKAVAQIIQGTKELVVRLFIEPDVDRLVETNTTAGSKLKQIAFDKTIVRQLHSTQYAEKIRRYQTDHKQQPDFYDFSEANLVDHFKGERGNIKNYIISSQKNAITKNQENKLSDYINFEGRGTELPLSGSTFDKTILSTFINSRTILTTNLNYKLDEGLNPRTLEKEQLIKLCNIIAEEILIEKYDPNIGTYQLEKKIADGKANDIPDCHIVACRLFKEEVMYNWVKKISDVIKNYYFNVDPNFNQDNLFQNKFSDQLWINITNFVKNLRDLPIWRNREVASTVFGGKQNYDYWKTIFSTGNTSDGTPVLSHKMDLLEMIKRDKNNS